MTIPNLSAIPNRVLELVEGWTVEDLAIAKTTDLIKVKGVGLVIARGLIEAAKDKLDEKKILIQWKTERKKLRERIVSRAIVTVQEVEQPEAMSVRIERIRKANA